MSNRFSNKVALVTGGSTGIGFATAEAFLREGAARVYITGRSQDSLATAAATLGAKAVPVRGDVASLADLDWLKKQVESDGEKLDVIFANAGVAEYNTFGTTSEAEFDRIIGINVKGVFFTVQTLLPVLRDGGAIVLTSSIVSAKGMPNLSLYNASKAAVRSFARTWANDLKERGIRVNAVSPGVTETPIFVNGLKLTQEQQEGFAAYVKESAPLGRVAVPAEIASAVLFLASDDASYVTGVELSVDGGLAQV